MADEDWRLTVTFQNEDHVQQAVQSVREHEVEQDVRDKLGARVAVSDDGPSVFVYADTEDAMREADRVIREILAQQQLPAEFALDRWHPVEQEWQDTSVPMPETAQELQAEHQRRIEDETHDSLATGEAEWEVRIEMPSHHEAVELAERLQAEGRSVLRRWRYLVVGANNEDQAADFAKAIEQEVPAKASVHTSAAPFMHFGLSRTGIEYIPRA